MRQPMEFYPVATSVDRADFKVDHDIALPIKGMPRKPLLRYPFEQMAVGDSFLVPQPGGSDDKARTRIASAAWHYGKPTGKKFSIRWMAREGGFRLWRIL